MRSVVWMIFCCLWLNVPAQQSVKRPLAIEDFNRWNTLSNTIISNDGQLIAFIQNPQKGDGMLIIKRGRRILIPFHGEAILGSDRKVISSFLILNNPMNL
jgi:hypothetical protein